MLKTNNPLLPFWYTPKAEQESENPTRFQLRGLTGLQRLDFLGESTSSGRVRIVLRYGLLSWENLTDSAGQPVRAQPELSPDGKEIAPATPPAELIHRLDESILLELAGAVIDATGLSPAAKKD